MVALAIMATVALTAGAIMESLVAAGQLSAQRATLWDRKINVERHVRSIVGRARIGEAPEMRFVGGPDSVAFATYCEAPAGWLERCRVSLWLSSDRSALMLGVSGRPPAAIETQARAFGYLLSADDDLWTREWDSGSILPLGISVITNSGTAIIRIGARG
jgi:type II secretory pathway component PulJ